MDKLKASVPDLDDLVAEHFADNDELLLHPLMSNFLRLAVSTFSKPGSTDGHGGDRVIRIVEG